MKLNDIFDILTTAYPKKILDIEHYISLCSTNQHEGYTEKHHILPRSMWPEHATCSWNTVRLSAYDHFICHWLLAKITDDRKMVFALNNMMRVLNTYVTDPDDIHHLAQLHSEFRERLAQEISAQNIGWFDKLDTIEQEKVRERSRKQGIGKIPCRRVSTGETAHLSVNDPRVVSGEYIHTSTGHKHSEDTKRLMSLRNKMRGPVYHNPETNEIKYTTEPPIGWVKGGPCKPHTSELFTDSVWFHNPETNQEFRTTPQSPNPPAGFVPGRGTFNNQLAGKIHLVGPGMHSIVLTSEEIRPPYYIKPQSRGVIAVPMKNDFSTIVCGSSAKSLAEYTGWAKFMFQSLVPNNIIKSAQRNPELQPFVGKTYHEAGFRFITPDEAQLLGLPWVA